MKQTTMEEISAGGVVYRKSDGNYEFLIGKHSGYHKWVLPKGLVEKGESQMQAAVREVEEEVGVTAKIVDLPAGKAGISPLKIIEYYYFADLETIKGVDAKGGESDRRVKHYQEDGGAKTRVHKQVIFYLMEMGSDLGSVGWEMEDRKWVDYAEAARTLAFESEREVLEAARKALGI